MMTFEAGPGVTVMVLDSRPKAAVRQQVELRSALGKCLMCEERAGRGMRGLCSVHYYRWRSARNSMPRKEQNVYDAKLMRTGKLMPNRQGQRLDRPNEFRQLAED